MLSNIADIKHPCFSLKCNRYGRIHLPVSPYCNISCVFCDRHSDACEERPGVSNKLLTPQEALIVLRKAMSLSNNITVVGIAGIGDSLASEHAFCTFRLINSEFPDLIKCMSTNGLLLPYCTDEIVDNGIKTLTVTVNSINPYILSRLCEFVNINGHVYYGIEGAKILVENQLDGISKITQKGIIVKVNSVLVPGINDDEIPIISKHVKQAGAILHNITPLIPSGKLKHHPKPTCEQLDKVRCESEKFITVFRNCHQCRADAIGIPGTDDIRKLVYQQCL